MMRAMTTTALIIGCGFLGTRIAQRLRARGDAVYATRTAPPGAAAMAKLGAHGLICDVTQPVTLAALEPAIDAEALDVYYLVPSGRNRSVAERRAVAIDGMNHVLARLAKANLRRAVLVSSTAVYDRGDGATVNADTPADPVSPHGRLLHEQEQTWLAAGPQYRVLRLAGLYGPGRIIGKQALRDGAPLVGNPGALLNLIHVDDAADLAIAMADSDHAARIELGCDGSPAPRLDYYRHLAGLIEAGDPIVLSDDDAEKILGLSAARLKRSSSKVCDNTPTCKRLNWQPRYTDYRAGLEASLAVTQ